MEIIYPRRIIGIVCRQCTNLTTEIYREDIYKKKLKEWQDEFAVAQVVSTLDGRIFDPTRPPFPTFYCRECGVVIEPPLDSQPFNYAARTEIEEKK